MSYLNYLTTVKPKYCYDTAEILSFAQDAWFSTMDELNARKAKKIFQGAQIDRRYSVEPLEVVFGNETFEEKNNRYMKAVKQLARDLLDKAFQESGISPQDIDYIITVSCTGFMIPSVDAYFLQEFSFRNDVVRLPITEMGCAGGIAGIQYAHEFLKGASTRKTAMVMTLEAPSLTFGKHDLSPENLVSTAIFADGASVLFVSNEPSAKASARSSLKVESIGNFHFPDSTYYMGYNLTNKGLKIVLDKEVPDGINRHLPAIFDKFLAPTSRTLREIDHFLLHPGGKKIIQSVENYLKPLGKNVHFSQEVLRTRGNMSSATVMHILEMAWPEIKAGESALSLAFGPGFSALGVNLSHATN